MENQIKSNKSPDYEGLEFKRQLIHLLNGSAIALATYFLMPIFGRYILWPLALAIFLMHVMPKVAPKFKLMNDLFF